MNFKKIRQNRLESDEFGFKKAKLAAELLK
jgi:hypothetical protein